MSTYVRTLKEKTTDDTVYPVTKAGAVYMEDEESTVEDEIGALNSKLTPSSGSYCIKVGGVCFITYIATGLSISGQNGLVCTLPSGYRPSELRHITALATYGGASGVFRFTVDTNGEVKTYIGGNTVTAIYMENLPFPL